jgi:integrase
VLQRLDHISKFDGSTKPKQPFVLFQRDRTNWSMRYTINGRQIRKSLGTTDEVEAYRLANEIWHEQNYRLKQGLSAKEHSFKEAAEEFIAQIELEAARKERSSDHVKYWVPKIRRFLIGYFGDKPIDRISPAEIERYLEWRKTYWTSGPGTEIDEIRCERADGRIFSRPVPQKVASISTIKGEMVIIRSLFQQAARWGYCQQIIVPTPRARVRIDNRRPGFTQEEYAKFFHMALTRISEMQPKTTVVSAKDGRAWTRTLTTKNIKSDRIRLYCYIEIMAHSGMRPTEAKNLIWANIIGFRECKDKPIGQRDVRLQVRGKGKHGTSIPLLDVIPALAMLWEMFETEVGREPGDNDPVFADAAGKAILSFKKGFNELLKAAGLEYDYRGVRRTPYSLRHFYISQMLIKGASIYDVALNTRTSLQMIEQHYAHVATEHIKHRLRPGQTNW